jgi:hypothetical protein
MGLSFMELPPPESIKFSKLFLKCVKGVKDRKQNKERGRRRGERECERKKRKKEKVLDHQSEHPPNGHNKPNSQNQQC